MAIVNECLPLIAANYAELLAPGMMDDVFKLMDNHKTGQRCVIDRPLDNRLPSDDLPLLTVGKCMRAPHHFIGARNKLKTASLRYVVPSEFENLHDVRQRTVADPQQRSLSRS